MKNIPATTPVAILNLHNNSLTHVPANLPQFTQLQTLIVASNKITAVNANDVTLVANVTFLDFSNNQISVIEAGSLPGNNYILFRVIQSCFSL